MQRGTLIKGRLWWPRELEYRVWHTGDELAGITSGRNIDYARRTLSDEAYAGLIVETAETVAERIVRAIPVSPTGDPVVQIVFEDARELGVFAVCVLMGAEFVYETSLDPDPPEPTPREWAVTLEAAARRELPGAQRRVCDAVGAACARALVPRGLRVEARVED